MTKQETMFSDTEMNSIRTDKTDLEKLRRIEKSILPKWPLQNGREWKQ